MAYYSQSAGTLSMTLKLPASITVQLTVCKLSAIDLPDKTS